MKQLTELFEKNNAWATGVTTHNPEFFTELAKQQSPKYLWIGCSDSRIPATQLLGLQPGEVFVHRNIANMVLHTDLNCLSVIQYAVDVVKVKHIIVCGHYGCGGINAALDGQEHGVIDNWLRHIQDVYHHHQQELDAVQDAEEKSCLLSEKNVMAQVTHVCEAPFIKKAWQAKQDVTVHGLIYSLKSGLLKDLNISRNH
ncbi:MAG: carbonic anhydrase [Thiomargarita sp.]|nr:carbonic anhydrase [Thiomargarita sp.]